MAQTVSPFPERNAPDDFEQKPDDTGHASEEHDGSEPPSSSSGAWKLGEWHFEPHLNRLKRDGECVRLEPKVAALLAHLIEKKREVVSKDDLVSAVWEGRFVADSALTRTMTELRRALGDDARDPHYVETISKKGYRLLVEPEWIDSASEATPPLLRRSWVWGAVAAVGILAALLAWRALEPGAGDGREAMNRIRSVVVLPLEDLSPEPGGDYFASSMTEALNTDLARLGVFRVISSRSIEQYIEASGSPMGLAEELGAEATVGGSILRADGRVRINIQLTEVATGTHLWAESYERPFVDVLRLQREVAGAIADALGRSHQGDDEMTEAAEEDASWDQVDPNAHDLYLQGMYLLRRVPGQGANGSREFFERALLRDPTFALAHTGLAEYFNSMTLFEHLPPHEGFPRARGAALAALALDPDLGEAHAALAQVEFFFDWNWDGAGERFRQAIELNPSYARTRRSYSFYLTCMGLFDEAERQARIEIELDPLNPRHHLAWVLFNARRFEDSLAASEAGRALKGAGKGRALVDLWSLAFLGRFEESLAGLEERSGWKKPSKVALGVLGWVYARADRDEEALAVLERIRSAAATPEEEDLYSIAIIHTGLGDHEKALDYLERAVLARSPNAVYLKVEPFLDPLRDDPRYVRLLVGTRLDSDQSPPG